MGLTRVAISRPVFILMVLLGLVLMGAVSYTRLGAELFPSINVPVVTVVTAYPGAAPDDVERLVTRPIENAVAGISNVDVVSSSSAEGQSTVTITFTERANTDSAATDVERRVSAIRAGLPADVLAPSVLKLDISQLAIISFTLSGNRPLDQLYVLANDTIKPVLEAADGVASVNIAGGLQREITVKVDPDQLRAYGVSLDQIQAALARENISQPGGSIDRQRQQINVRVSGLFQSVDHLRHLIISQGPSGRVALKDVAVVEDAFKRVTSTNRLNGANTVTVSVTKQASANEVKTADAVHAKLRELRTQLPTGVALDVISDSSKFTRTSLDSVNITLVEAVALTGLVLLLFLHTLRSTLIVLFAIPTSLVSTFLAMSVLGFTLNIMSTLALVLVIGVLVDDSIVVLENIVRHLELGETPWAAAIKGRSEIGLAAIGITLVDVVIFLPVAFLTGTTGGFFKQFALVIVCSVLLSLFVSFTLTPMLASRWLKAETIEVRGHGPWARFAHAWEGKFAALQRGYRRLLGWVLRRRWLPPIIAVASLVVAFALIPLGLLKFEFIPASDNGLFQISAELPPGASLAATDDVMRQIEQRLATVAEVKFYLTTAGGAGGGFGGGGGGARRGSVSVVLHDLAERKARGQRSVFAVSDQLNRDLADIPGATIRASATGGGGGGQPVQVLITGPDQAQVDLLAAQVERIVRDTPGATSVTNSGATSNPEVRLVVDRDKLADFGLNAQQVAAAVRTAVEGATVTKLRPTGQDEVDVRLIAADAARADIEALADIPLTAVRGGQPVQIKLGQVTQVEQVAGATALARRNRQRVITVGATLTTGTVLNQVTGPIDAKINQLRAAGAVPTGYRIEQGGQAQSQAAAFGQLLLAVGLSIALIYMLMAALYESFILPFATMIALPVAIVGAFVALAVTGNTINLLVMIGLIVLMGLVGKNGILLVDYTNTLRERGLSRTEALLEAGPTRLRPILMTTMALVFGLLPMAAKIHEGSELWAGIGVAIIGGLLSSTLLSLVVVPTMYTYFDDLQGGLKRLASWRPARRMPLPGGLESERPLVGSAHQNASMD